jgi:group II intron reverse transcriptase/maturase
LENLQKHAKVDNYKYERLYRNLYNPEFYLQAYQNIYANKGAMTPGIDNQNFSGLSKDMIENIITQIKNHKYQPNPVKRVYIPKKNGKMRPLGISSSADKLVQEVIRMILESIYEPTFSKHSHGFRHDKSCHTALQQIQNTFTGIKWFIEGDIKGYFDNIDHHILVNILREKIRDEAFIEIIWKFLRAGYMENWKYNTTYSGVAQGSGFSPLLANLYLDKLDKYVEEYKTYFDKGQARRYNNAYKNGQSKYLYYKKKYNKMWSTMNKSQKEIAKTELKALREEMLSIPSTDPLDENYRRLQYTRYADDFLIGVIGSKNDAIEIKQDIKEFLQNKLKLELSDEKTLITSGKDKAKFLSYEITICQDTKATKTKRGKSRVYNGRVKLYLPKEKWIKKLKEYNMLKIINTKGNKEVWKPLERGELAFLKPNEIVMKYNEQIRGLYNYYKLASNVSVLNKYYYIAEYSMYKTFALKYRITMTQAKLKYTRNNEFAVPYETKSGTKYAVFYNKGFTKSKKPMKEQEDILQEFANLYKPKELYRRIKKEKCELCGKENTDVKVYQVASMKELDNNYIWHTKMKSLNRKTLIVCNECHRLITENM